jgi:CubicO group peptidase (beta-lactamase class C family)
MRRRDFLSGAAAFALDKPKLGEAVKLVRKAISSHYVAEAALEVCQERVPEASLNTGRVFLLASISKPMTTAGLMILADRGQLSLRDTVRKFVPEFTGGDRDLITIRHLLTHTSGLPDMLPENTELRRRHAPLKDFVAATCKTPLLFKPGTEVRYQSMGILLAAEIAERITQRPFRDFLHDELFRPLGMRQTSLGLGGRRIADTALCQVTGDDDWNWNSPYWRNLGSPWGGVHSTASDVTTFLKLFLHPDGGVLKRETVAAMITNQTPGLKKPWGLGWMIEPGTFGQACSARTFGHSGSTGTLAWCDPATGITFVLLTTKPAAESRDRLLGPVSDMVSQAG